MGSSGGDALVPPPWDAMAGYVPAPGGPRRAAPDAALRAAQVSAAAPDDAQQRLDDATERVQSRAAAYLGRMLGRHGGGGPAIGGSGRGNGRGDDDDDDDDEAAEQPKKRAR